MTEEDDTMMLELKKKKKKKKPANLDELISSSSATEVPVPAENQNQTSVTDDLEELSLTGLKKKKKKKKPILDDEDLKDKINENQEANEDIEKSATFDDDELDLTKAKKKKKKDVTFAQDQIEDEDDTILSSTTKSWLDSDRDYTYDELLTRVFDIMRKKNPEMVAGEKKRFIMKPPQCARVGTRKTSFINFSDICKVLGRTPKHVLAFILAELGTSGSVDGNSQLIIKGRFQQKQLESVLRRYIKEYVTCHTCRSPDTALERKDRLYFLRCNVCQSRCSVASIKSGFQAVTGKRARMRAKAT